ncbi:MAG: DUF4190 domain-containing protein [Phycisphaerae bacterium]|nr:DUF4190 domain-containing protein [Phycisphaerae bacterium]
MQEQSPEPWADQPRPAATNVLGIVGFVLAFCLSPIGLILSLVALAKPPRGFAIAGSVVGLIGTIVWVVLGLGMFFGGDIIVKAFGLGADHGIIESQLNSYAAAHNGEIPADLVTAGVPESARKDPWDHEYKFVRSDDGKSWTLTSASFDGQFGTADDAVFTKGMTQRDVSRVIQEAIDGHMKSRGAAPPPVSTSTPDAAPPAGEQKSE